MEKDTDTRSSDQINLSGIVITQLSSKSGEPISQKISSLDSASLPDSELVPQIIIRDEERGISIEYIEGARTRGVVELLFKRLTQKSVEAPLPDSQLQRITIEALRQAPLAENEFMLSWQEQTEAYLFFFPDKHFVQGHAKAVTISKVSVQEADNIVLQQLAETNIISVKYALKMKEAEVAPSHKPFVEVAKKEPVLHPEVATKPVAEQRAELAQRFVFEDVSKIPPGVDPKQLDFLREAASVGGFEWVKDYTAEMITKYFTSEITQIDLGKEYGITKQAVQERITRGMNKMRRILYRDKPELAEEDKYPLEQIQKGKDETEIFKSERHKEIRSQASGLRKPGREVRKKPNLE